MEPGRNERCPCGSGLKYKRCHLGRADTPPDAEAVWRRVHQVSLRLPTALLGFAARTYPSGVLDEAWRDFALKAEESFDPDSVHLPVFMPWFFYHWVPGSRSASVSAQIGTFPLAAAYLHGGGPLDALSRRYLEAGIGSAFTFLDLVEVSPGWGFWARDALTGVESSVIEKSASQTVRKGDILFAKIISIDGLAILDGCSAIPFPPRNKGVVIDLREKLAGTRLRLAPEELAGHGRQLLRVYHSIAEQLLHPQPPELQNTDGDPLIFCRVTFEVPSARSAFDCLQQLSGGVTEAELLAPASFDQDGELLTAHLPWVEKGAAHFPGGELSLGEIRIQGQRLVAETNSERRAQRFRGIAERLLPAGSRHLSTVLESVEAALAAARREGRLETPPETDELNQRPEVKAILSQFLQTHYRDWPHRRLPALKNKTPMQAMRSPGGREMVEALLLDLEQNMDANHSVTPEILAELRTTLALGDRAGRRSPKPGPTQGAEADSS